LNTFTITDWCVTASRTYLIISLNSALSPFIFVVFHSDLVNCFGAHSCHLFADDLIVLIRAPLQRSFHALSQYLEIEGTKVYSKITKYSRLWKQPINVGKSVAQVSHSQVKISVVNVSMLGQKLEIANSFNYLGFTWKSKLSLKPTVDKYLKNIQKLLNKLKWLQAGRSLDKDVLRRCFFSYTFPYFAWAFPFFPLLPRSQ
jgi:hypothetical protein